MSASICLSSDSDSGDSLVDENATGREPGNGLPVLSETVVKEITGKTNLQEVSNLEVIFTPTPGLEVLRKIPNLCKMTLIGTQLSQIPPSLSNVRHSLESLTLVNQKLVRIQNLDLPNLRELFLQNNEIKRIEGLEQCTKLRRLWLNDNRIRKMENLFPLGDLRELSLAGNSISEIEGFESQGVLRELHLSNNPISSFKHIQKLSVVESLREISFADKGYIPCPVAQLEGYRSFVLCALKQVRSVDGVHIENSERKNAEDEYLERVLEFNDRIDDIRREHEKELLAVESRRQQVLDEADTLHSQLSHTFNDLEHVVKQGRERISTAQEHQFHLRESNMKALMTALNRIEKAYSEKIDELIDEQLRLGKEEEDAFARLESMALLDMNESLLLCDLQKRDESKPDSLIVAQTLLGGEEINAQSTSGELQSLNEQIRNSQNLDNAILQLKLQRAVKICNPSHVTAHHREMISRLSCGAEASQDPLTVNVPYFPTQYYLPTDVAGVKASLRHGVKPNVKSHLTLFQNPQMAVEFASEEDFDGTTCVGANCKLHRFLVCTVANLDSPSISSCTRSQAIDIDHLSNIVSLAPSMSTIKVEVSQGNDVESQVGTVLLVPCSHVVIENYIVLQHEHTSSTPVQVTMDSLFKSAIANQGQTGQNLARSGHLRELDLPVKEMDELQQLEEKLQGEFERYEQRVMEELDPVSYNRLSEATGRVRELKDELKSLRAQIDSEKANQEQLLREFKASRSNSNASSRVRR